MLHLNSQVRKYDGFTPGHRVFGRTHKIPIGAVGNPNFCDFMDPADSPVDQTHQVLVEQREIQEASLEIDFRGTFNIAISNRLRDLEREGFSLRGCLFLSENGVNKADFKWKGPGIVIGRFGRKCDLLYYRGGQVAVDLNDIRHGGNIFDGAGCDLCVIFEFNG